MAFFSRAAKVACRSAALWSLIALVSCAHPPSKHRHLDKIKLTRLSAGADAAGGLIEEASRDSDERFRALAMDTIARLGLVELAPLVLRTLNADQSIVAQLHALSAYVSLQGSASTPGLEAILRTDWAGANVEQVRAFARAELCALDDAMGLRALSEAAAEQVAVECAATSYEAFRADAEAKRRREHELRQEAEAQGIRKAERDRGLREANAAPLQFPDVRVLLAQGALRADPSEIAAPIAELNLGSDVNVLARGSEWSLVRAGEREGWARTEVLGTPLQCLDLLRVGYAAAKRARPEDVWEAMDGVRRKATVFAERLPNPHAGAAKRFLVLAEEALERQAQAAERQARLDAAKQERERQAEEARAERERRIEEAKEARSARGFAFDVGTILGAGGDEVERVLGEPSVAIDLARIGKPAGSVLATFSRDDFEVSVTFIAFRARAVSITEKSLDFHDPVVLRRVRAAFRIPDGDRVLLRGRRYCVGVVEHAVIVGDLSCR